MVDCNSNHDHDHLCKMTLEVKEKGYYRIQAYFSSIQHKSLILDRFVVDSSQMTSCISIQRLEN